ncbi:hypothetical protein MTO96_047404 [Rhipicephalus appendiculatus]
MDSDFSRFSVLSGTDKLVFISSACFFRSKGLRTTVGGKKWLQHRDLANAAAEFRWRQMLTELRASLPKKPSPSKDGLHSLVNVSLPENIRSVLSRGPKYAVEPRKSRAELLGLVRSISRKASADCAESCVSEDPTSLSTSMPTQASMHYISRQSPYPGTKIQRFPVPDKFVPWEAMWLDYDPVTYTRPRLQFPGPLQIYVDEDILMYVSAF